MEHYKIEDAATIKCSTSENGCPGVIEFKPGEHHKFCSVCGREVNKLHYGYSPYQYADITAKYAKEHLANIDEEFYFMQDSKTNGPGHTILTVVRFYDMRIHGYIDADKISISFKEDNVSIDALCRESGPWATTASYKTYDLKSIDIRERWMYDHTSEDFSRAVNGQLKGFQYETICKEKFYSVKKEIISQNLTELARYNADERVSTKSWRAPMTTMRLSNLTPLGVIKSLKRYANKQTTVSELSMFMQMKTGSGEPLVKEKGFGDRGHLRMSMSTNDRRGNRVGRTIVEYLDIPGDSRQVFITGFDFYLD